MVTVRVRTVPNNAAIIDQADFFQSDGFTRQTGLTTSQITLQLFFNNAIQPWTFVNGAPIADAQVASGNVYFNEIASNPGFYSVRFRPIGIGYWRLILTYGAGTQIQSQDYDVIPSQTPDTNLNASFIKPGC